MRLPNKVALCFRPSRLPIKFAQSSYQKRLANEVTSHNTPVKVVEQSAASLKQNKAEERGREESKA